jgi:hypothetical protein
MRFRLRNGVVAIAVAAIVAASAVGVAAAAGPGPISGGPAGTGVCAVQSGAARSNGTAAVLRAFGDCEIDRRLVTLDQLSAAVGAAKGLRPADAASLSGDIATSRSGLTSLRATLDGQTALGTLRIEIVEIVTKYRVYVLLGPQVRLVVAADDVLGLGPHMNELSSALAGRIAAAKAAGKDVTAAQTSLDAMNAQITSAEALAAPLPARLLALTPAQFDAGTAGPTLQTARTDLIHARDALGAATQDGRALLAALK